MVPVGILSFTITVSGAVPWLLSNVIVYVIVSPASTVLPELGLDDLLICTFGLFTVSVTSFVDVPSTVAVLLIVLEYVPDVKVFTVTAKLNVAEPLAGTFTVIPLDKFDCVLYVVELFTLILPDTKLVPLGIVSFITTFLLKLPSFLTVIVYVILSPSTT